MYAIRSYYDQNRIIANLNITQELLEGLSIAFTGGVDTYSQFSKVHGAIAKVTPGSNNSRNNFV